MAKLLPENSRERDGERERSAGIYQRRSHEEVIVYSMVMVPLTLSFIRIVALLNSIFHGIVGVWMCLETHHDMLYARYDLLKSFHSNNVMCLYRSHILVPCSYIGMWYLVQDFYAMYRSCKLSRKEYMETPTLQLFGIYLREELPFILHHIFLLICGFIVAVRSINVDAHIHNNGMVNCYNLVTTCDSRLNSSL